METPNHSRPVGAPNHSRPAGSSNYSRPVGAPTAAQLINIFFWEISVLVVHTLTQFISTTSAVFPMRSLERIECSIIADSLYDTMIDITIHIELIMLSTVESHTHTHMP